MRLMKWVGLLTVLVVAVGLVGCGGEDSFESIKAQAMSGDAGAQHNLGVLYQRGLGVEQDYKEAVKWYLKAAEQEYADAQRNLGVMYQNGLGVEQNAQEAHKWCRKAEKWYRIAAEQGDAAAQRGLGVLYFLGIGVEPDFKESIRWLRKSA